MTYYLGLDLGQLQDHSARAVVHVASPTPGLPAPNPPAPLRCIGLHRWQLKTKYATIVTDMQAFLGGLPEGEEWELVVDGTGVGVAVLEQFDLAHIPYTSVSIHGGEATIQEGNKWRVPKKALVAVLQVAAQNRTLTVEPPTMPYARELRHEMGNFRHTITAAAHDTYAAWRESDHDDLVLALAIACWKATQTVVDNTVVIGSYLGGGRDIPPYGKGVAPYGQRRPY